MVATNATNVCMKNQLKSKVKIIRNWDKPLFFANSRATVQVVHKPIVMSEVWILRCSVNSSLCAHNSTLNKGLRKWWGKELLNFSFYGNYLMVKHFDVYPVRSMQECSVVTTQSGQAGLQHLSVPAATGAGYLRGMTWRHLNCQKHKSQRE